MGWSAAVTSSEGRTGEQSMSSNAVDLLGCRFHAVTQQDAVDQIFRWCDDPDRQTHTVITVNVAILMMMRSNPQLAHAIRRADLVVTDGMPLVWSSGWLGSPVPRRRPGTTGTDLMLSLLEAGGQRRLRVFLLGTTEERLTALKKVIAVRFPDVVLAGARNGYFRPEESPQVAAAIRESRADLLLVGMPAPFKEIWCEEHRGDLNTPAILGVGGAFDVLAGFVPRAPVLFQNAGLEWAWRLMMEPRKLWKRYLVTNSRFLVLLGKTLAAAALRRRK
jgi:N-acetylglucosaminyldiphosphoundecaprenol N-acetyl-beta-D-mannosaminyltransferase